MYKKIIILHQPKSSSLKPKQQTPELDEKIKQRINEIRLMGDTDRWEFIKRVVTEDIVGDKVKNTAVLIWTLKVGDKLGHYSSVIFQGDSSGGKSYPAKRCVEGVGSIKIIDTMTATALKNDPNLEQYDTLFYSELPKSKAEEFTEIFKVFYEGPSVHATVQRKRIGHEEVFQTSYIHHRQLGLLTTCSFSWLQVDLLNRSWVIAPDQSFTHTEEITDFHIDRNLRDIDYLIEKKSLVIRSRFYFNMLNH